MGDNDDCRFDAGPYLTGPDPSKPLKVTITTRRYDGKVEQDTDIMGHVTRRMMNIREMQADHAIRDALIGLGWTPPGGDAYLEGVKAGLETAKEALAKKEESLKRMSARMRNEAQYDTALGYATQAKDTRDCIRIVSAIDPATITRKGGADG